MSVFLVIIHVIIIYDSLLCGRHYTEQWGISKGRITSPCLWLAFDLVGELRWEDRKNSIQDKPT